MLIYAPVDSDVSVSNYFILISKPFTVLFHYLTLQTTERHLDRQIPQSADVTREMRGQLINLFEFENSYTSRR